MFFLGGFNSIFPYLIYLSLIWIFLLVGVHGKLRDFWHAAVQKKQRSELSVHFPSEERIVYFTPETKAPLKVSTVQCLPVAGFTFPVFLEIGRTICHNSLFVVTFLENSFSRRGPPSTLV
jgi:hypothetical protein